MKIDFYVINLDQSDLRMRRFEQDFALTGFQLKRIAAVDGRELADDEVRKVLASDALLALDEIGCFLSHRKAWKRLLSSDAQYAVIFEDDAYLSPMFKEHINAFKDIEDQIDVLKIEARTDRTVAGKKKQNVKLLNREVFELRSIALGSAAYIVSKVAATKLLELSEKLDCPVDVFLFDPLRAHSYQLKPSFLTPGLSIQRRFIEAKSDAYRSTVSRSARQQRRKWVVRLSPLKKFKRECRRVALQSVGLFATKLLIPFE